MGSLESTNHSSFPDWEALTPDPGATKISHCRFCRYPGHTITSCIHFHTHGYETVPDNDLSRKFGCSVVYYFPNKPQQEYDASKLKNPPIQELKSTSAFSSQYNNIPDFSMDEKKIIIKEQEYHFKKQRKKIKNSKIVGNRKKKRKNRVRLEIRLLKGENENSNEDTCEPSFKYSLASVTKLKEELS